MCYCSKKPISHPTHITQPTQGLGWVANLQTELSYRVVYYWGRMSTQLNFIYIYISRK